MNTRSWGTDGQAPTVSIVFPALNEEAAIGRCVKQAAETLARTGLRGEVVVVDDGSRDRTAAVAREYAARDRRVRVVVNGRNLGDYPNRNHAASLAHGPLV